jgi:hypothetical protein
VQKEKEMSVIAALDCGTPAWTQLFNKVNEIINRVANKGVIQVKVAVTADGSSGINFTVPYDMEITDIIVHPTAANASATAQVRVSTTAISDAIACAVLDTIGRAGTIDQTYKILEAGTTYNVITNGADDRCEVCILGVNV